MTDQNKSIAVWDMAPDDGGAPGQVQMIRGYADAQIALWPKRYCLVQPGDVAPLERSDGKPINPPAGT